jgi:hypothetical protein
VKHVRKILLLCRYAIFVHDLDKVSVLDQSIYRIE